MKAGKAGAKGSEAVAKGTAKGVTKAAKSAATGVKKIGRIQENWKEGQSSMICVLISGPQVTGLIWCKRSGLSLE